MSTAYHANALTRLGENDFNSPFRFRWSDLLPNVDPANPILTFRVINPIDLKGYDNDNEKEIPAVSEAEKGGVYLLVNKDNDDDKVDAQGIPCMDYEKGLEDDRCEDKRESGTVVSEEDDLRKFELRIEPFLWDLVRAGKGQLHLKFENAGESAVLPKVRVWKTEKRDAITAYSTKWILQGTFNLELTQSFWDELDNGSEENVKVLWIEGLLPTEKKPDDDQAIQLIAQYNGKMNMEETEDREVKDTLVINSIEKSYLKPILTASGDMPTDALQSEYKVCGTSDAPTENGWCELLPDALVAADGATIARWGKEATSDADELCEACPSPWCGTEDADLDRITPCGEGFPPDRFYNNDPTVKLKYLAKTASNAIYMYRVLGVPKDKWEEITMESTDVTRRHWKLEVDFESNVSSSSSNTLSMNEDTSKLILKSRELVMLYAGREISEAEENKIAMDMATTTLRFLDPVPGMLSIVQKMMLADREPIKLEEAPESIILIPRSRENTVLTEDNEFSEILPSGYAESSEGLSKNLKAIEYQFYPDLSTERSVTAILTNYEEGDQVCWKVESETNASLDAGGTSNVEVALAPVEENGRSTVKVIQLLEEVSEGSIGKKIAVSAWKVTPEATVVDCESPFDTAGVAELVLEVVRNDRVGGLSTKRNYNSDMEKDFVKQNLVEVLEGRHWLVFEGDNPLPSRGDDVPPSFATLALEILLNQVLPRKRTGGGWTDASRAEGNDDATTSLTDYTKEVGSYTAQVRSNVWNFAEAEGTGSFNELFGVGYDDIILTYLRAEYGFTEDEGIQGRMVDKTILQGTATKEDRYNWSLRINGLYDLYRYHVLPAMEVMIARANEFNEDASHGWATVRGSYRVENPDGVIYSYGHGQSPELFMEQLNRYNCDFQSGAVITGYTGNLDRECTFIPGNWQNVRDVDKYTRLFGWEHEMSQMMDGFEEYTAWKFAGTDCSGLAQQALYAIYRTIPSGNAVYGEYPVDNNYYFSVGINAVKDYVNEFGVAYKSLHSSNFVGSTRHQDVTYSYSGDNTGIYGYHSRRIGFSEATTIEQARAYLKPGDILHLPGHVRIFQRREGRNINSEAFIIQADGRGTNNVVDVLDIGHQGLDETDQGRVVLWQ